MSPLKEATDFLRALNSNQVEYMIIGGAAVNIHGYTRSTGDLDIWYNPTAENFEKLLLSISDFGFETDAINDLASQALLKTFIRLPVDNFFIELLSSIDGKFSFEEAYENVFNFQLQDVVVPVIGYNNLIQNKIMARRAKDLEDIAQLEKRKKH